MADREEEIGLELGEGLPGDLGGQGLKVVFLDDVPGRTAEFSKARWKSPAQYLRNVVHRQVETKTRGNSLPAAIDGDGP